MPAQTPAHVPADLPLYAVPNVSEGRDLSTLDAIATQIVSSGARLLDRHHDHDHHRAVFTLTAEPKTLSSALLETARTAIAHIDLNAPRGSHPHVGAIDVVPVVYAIP